MKISLKNIRKKVLENSLRPFLRWYLSKNRYYRYEALHLVVFSGVFHPGFFFSTKIFLGFLKHIPALNKKILELGAGSGLISLEMAKRGGNVFASDISETAVNNIRENALRNNLAIQVVQSNLFQHMPEEKFDIILVNPPYYPRRPASEGDHAWYCGENFEYFQSFFNQMKDHVHVNSEVYMILSEDCDLSAIKKIAARHQIKMVKSFQKKKYWEWNYIFRIVPSDFG